MIKVALAEDNHFLAQSIEEKLSFFADIQFKFRAINGAEIIGKLEQDHVVDVLLMDIQMPEINGIKATEIIKKKYPQIKILMLTVFDDEEHIFNAILAGADGYLLKDENANNLYKSIIEILEGGAPMSPSIALKTLKLLRNPLNNKEPYNDYNLTAREIEVLEHLSKGLNYSEIADNLHISSGTVRKHIENTYKKLQVHNKTEAINLAQKERLI